MQHFPRGAPTSSAATDHATIQSLEKRMTILIANCM